MIDSAAATMASLDVGFLIGGIDAGGTDAGGTDAGGAADAMGATGGATALAPGSP